MYQARSILEQDDGAVPGPLNLHQQIVAMSMASNGLFSMTGTESHLATIMQGWLPGAIKELELTNWEVVFGPVVWKPHPENFISGPDNTWYVARNPSVRFPDGSRHEMYAVATAGSAELSEQDWVNEDSGILFCVDFDKWTDDVTKEPHIAWTPDDNAGSYIARGTAKAVHTMITVPAPTGSPGAGTNLLHFMRTVSPNAKVVYTGHSLGATMSSALAFALLKNVHNVTAENVFTFTYAGPCAGNRNFAKLFAATLPEKRWGPADYQTFNVNMHNTLDIVPTAWCIDKDAFPDQNLHKLFTIYGPHGDLELKTNIDLGIGLAELSRIRYYPIPTMNFTGKLKPTGSSVSLVEFVEVATVQHIGEYYRHIGIWEPTPPVPGAKISARLPLMAGILFDVTRPLINRRHAFTKLPGFLGGEGAEEVLGALDTLFDTERPSNNPRHAFTRLPSFLEGEGVAEVLGVLDRLARH